MTTLDTFTRAYLECALWASTDSEGEPLDAAYTIDDFSKEATCRMKKDCESFRAMAANKLAESGLTEEQAGHDFFLTRNGHGAGFWDRGLGQVGNDLTDIAHSFGNQDLYVSDANTVDVA